MPGKSYKSTLAARETSMSDNKRALIAQRKAVKKALTAKLAAGCIRNGGLDDSRNRTQKD
jgi:hypothetical protein